MPSPAARPSHRPFAPAWLSGEAAACRLLPRAFDAEESRREAAARASRRLPAEGLVDALARQHRDLPESASRRRSLDALASGEAAVVASGQQVGLFTGPAFSLYKAAGVVAAARRLAEESGVACVPVFWLQTEDHDWDEIDHCDVLDHEGRQRRLRVPGASTPARAPVACRVFDESLAVVLAELEEAVGPRPHGGEMLALMRRHYVAGASPASAFRGVLAELFADDGLLFLDPRTPEIAALAAPVLARALGEAARVGKVLEERAGELVADGFGVQVNVLDGSPLCFFHPDGAGGQRFRLEPGAAAWRLRGDGREIGREAAADLLARDPLHFSTSALLRPLVQDFLLPTAVVLAGPGEISYFAELAPLYDVFGLEMPLVCPRPAFCVTAAGDRRRLEALGTRFDALGGDREDVLKSLPRAGAAAPMDADDAERMLTGGFLAGLERFAAAATSVDAALARPVEKARGSVLHTVGRLVERYRHSLLHHDAVLVDRLDRLRAALAPGGLPQERVYGLASLAAEHGVGELLAGIRREMRPFEAGMREVAL